jgi:hypothetical protein
MPLLVNDDETVTLLGSQRTPNDYGYIPPGYGLLLNGNIARQLALAQTAPPAGDPSLNGAKQKAAEFSWSLGVPIGMDSSMLSADDQAIPPQGDGTAPAVAAPFGGTTNMNNSPPVSMSRREKLALRIDRYSALLFPALFALFNVFYW